jgi:hypothetical protein
VNYSKPYPPDDTPAERIIATIAALQLAIGAARIDYPGATISLGLLAYTESGGRVIASWDGGDFVADLVVVLGAPLALAEQP